MAARAQIMDEALELPADERAELAAKLLDSLEPTADARLGEPCRVESGRKEAVDPSRNG